MINKLNRLIKKYWYTIGVVLISLLYYILLSTSKPVTPPIKLISITVTDSKTNKLLYTFTNVKQYNIDADNRLTVEEIQHTHIISLRNRDMIVGK